MKRLAVFVALVLASALATADDLAAVSSLKVDLEAVVKQGLVKPVDGITSAGQPDAAAFEVFAESGYAAVIDIRTEGENRRLDEPAVVEGLGMEYVLFPIGHDDVTVENARALFEVLSQYDGPVLVHCASANRVGALFALKEFDDTGDVESALEKGRAAGMTRLEGRVKKVLGVE